MAAGVYFLKQGYIADVWMVGLILSTTSLGVVLPVLKERNLTAEIYGQTILIAALLADFATIDFNGENTIDAAIASVDTMPDGRLTVDKKTMTIVNISGGGCPDVPFLAQEMVGKRLSEAPSPRAIGHTLCGYALQLAYEEMQRQCLR